MLTTSSTATTSAGPVDADAPTKSTTAAEGLVLDGLVKRFGSVRAVDGVSLHVEPGQLVSFLGPSGCGKTTLLRLIAGLDKPNAGRVIVDGEDLTSRPAHRRDIGMVFQSLALFPHLNVRRNIGYGLKIRRAEKAAIAARVDELLRLVDLDGLADREVGQLSGGQRQRVAIARALARNPALFLLDEPMSALDANLRESLQVELRLLQQELNITTIMVTHDQREAMTMSDIIVVLNNGKVEQVGAPIDVYRHPKTAFTAAFLGTTNLLRGRKTTGQAMKVGLGVFEIDGDLPVAGADLTVSIRPTDLVIEAPDERPAGPNRLPGVVSFVRDLGATFECFVDCGLDELVTVQGISGDRQQVVRGDEVVIHFPTESCALVDDDRSDDAGSGG